MKIDGRKTRQSDSGDSPSVRLFIKADRGGMYIRKIWTGRGYRYVYAEPTGRRRVGHAVSGRGARLKNLARQQDVEHSLAMIKKMYGKREPGMGDEMPVSSIADFKKIVENTTYSMMSAGLSPAEIDEGKLGAAEVKKRTQSLKNDLKAGGYVFTSCRGKYGAKEESFMVMMHDADRKAAMSLGKKYNQEAIVFSRKGKAEMIHTTGEHAGKAMMRADKYKFQPKRPGDDFYTDIPIGGKTRRFSLMMDDVAKALRKIVRRLRK